MSLPDLQKFRQAKSSHTSACVVGERLVSRNSGWGSSLAVAFFFRQERKVLHAAKASFCSGLVSLISSYPPLPTLATPLDYAPPSLSPYNNVQTAT